jgi:hypothetical protein
MLSKEELLKFLKTNCLTKTSFLSSSKINQYLKNDIILKESLFHFTSFLPNDNTISNEERYYCLNNNITKRNMCEICNLNPTKFNRILYSSTCSNKCRYEKIKKTCLERHGCENPFQKEEFKEKIKQTCLEKYGCENPFQNEEIKEKIKNVSLKKYGCENPFQNEEIKNKAKKTTMERYGVEYASQNEEVKKKSKKTCLEKYGNEYVLQNKEVRNKSKKTCLERYGNEYALQNEEVKEKRKVTCLENYGKEYTLQNKEIRERAINTSLKRYGCKSPTQKHILNIELFNVEYIINNFVYINRGKKKLDKKKVLLFFNINITSLNTYLKNNKKAFEGIQLDSFGNMEKELQKEILKMFPLDLAKEEVLINDRKALQNVRKELDIYIPKLNIAIEYNGLLYHSFGKHKRSIFNNFEKEAKEKYLHQIKTNLCEEKGISLFQINEDEWLNQQKKKIWLNILKQNISIKLKELNNKNNENVNLSYEYNENIYIKEIDYNNIQKNKEIIITFLENNSLEYNEYSFNNLFLKHKENNVVFFGLYDKKTSNLISLIYGFLGFVVNNVSNFQQKEFTIVDICNSIDFIEQDFQIDSKLNNYKVIKYLFNYLKTNNTDINNILFSTQNVEKITYYANRRWNKFSLIDSFNDLMLINNEVDNNETNVIAFKTKPNYLYILNNNIHKIYQKEELNNKNKIINIVNELKQNKKEYLKYRNNKNVNLNYEYNDNISKTYNLYNIGFRRIYDSGNIRIVMF